MDEVPMSFDAPYTRTVDTTGAESIPISTTGHERTGFRVVLSCSESGKKLKPMVIFKRVTMPKERIPDGAVVHCHKKGWMDRVGMVVWGGKVWHARPVYFFNRTSLLIFDSFSAHVDHAVRQTFKNEHKTNTAVIPGGLAKKLQPLDISVNRSFKNHVREEWEKWMSDGIHTFTQTGKIRKASHAEVCSWVIQAWKAVSIQTITNGFRKAGISTNPAGVIESDIEVEKEINNDGGDAELESDVGEQAVNNEQFLELFHSDIEDEEFNGF